MLHPRVVVLPLSILLAGAANAQVTARVSVATGGAQGNADSTDPSISADGRFVVFASFASNLAPADTNGWPDVFLRDLQAGTTERVSLDWGGAQLQGISGEPSVSGDGRYVAFSSTATTVVPGDTNVRRDVFVRDRQARTTVRVSVATGGTQGNDDAFDPSISADGRYVAFYSDATNLVVGDTNGVTDVFVHDRQTGTTERASLGGGGVQGNGASHGTSISADGHFVAFRSYASNLVTGDTNGTPDIFVRDRLAGTTVRVSVATGGGQGDGGSVLPSISEDGRFVAFMSGSTNLVPSDTNTVADVFVHDRVTVSTERVSVATGGAEADSQSQYPSISPDGRYVSFGSFATNLVPGDTNAQHDVFLHDRLTGTTERASVGPSSAQAILNSTISAVSADGRFVLFDSYAWNLVAGDTNASSDVFLRDRDATGFTSLCDPGTGGVLACPCANPPSGAGRGCDNSAATGGAALSAAGTAYLSADTLVLTTSGERPTATSIVLQGKSEVPGGALYGQGVRCLGGTLKRLFTKNAVGGSVTAPGPSDPAISVQSALKGDVIQPGQSRWYLVYYRDPMVLGGCPAVSTFNATQTGRVDWMP